MPPWVVLGLLLCKIWRMSFDRDIEEDKGRSIPNDKGCHCRDVLLLGGFDELMANESLLNSDHWRIEGFAFQNESPMISSCVVTKT